MYKSIHRYAVTYILTHICKEEKKNWGRGDAFARVSFKNPSPLTPTKDNLYVLNDIKYFITSYREKTAQPALPAPPFSYCTLQTPWAEAKI